MIECPDCKGFGERLIRGPLNDPELEEVVICERCDGEGEIEGEDEE